MKRIAMVVALVCSASCAMPMTVVRIGKAGRAKPPDCDLPIYKDGADLPHSIDRIAHLETLRGAYSACDEETSIRQIREQACTMGADALIELKSTRGRWEVCETRSAAAVRWVISAEELVPETPVRRPDLPSQTGPTRRVIIGVPTSGK